MGAGCSRNNKAATQRMHALLVSSRADEHEFAAVLRAGADPLAVHPVRRYTPLTLACLNEHDAFVRLLLKDARVQKTVDARSGPSGMRVTALHAAVLAGSISSVARLLKHSNGQSVNEHAQTPRQLLESRYNSMPMMIYNSMIVLFTDRERRDLLERSSVNP